MHPLSLLVTCVAGWMNGHQQALIEYLQEEVRVLKAQVGKRPHFTDDQRRRLGIRAKAVGRKGLMRFASIVTPDTLLAWHRRLIAQKYDSSQRRRPGRPRTAADLQELILRMARGNRSWDYTRIQGALAWAEVGEAPSLRFSRRRALIPRPSANAGRRGRSFCERTGKCWQRPTSSPLRFGTPRA
jgi:hypothetical protein